MTLLAVATSGSGLVDPETPVLHADNGAVLRGRAAFETLRVYAGTPFRYEAHLKRLNESGQRIGLPPVDRADVDALAQSAIRAGGQDDAVLRLYWTPGRESEDRARALVLVSALPDDLDEIRARGVKLISLTLGFDTDLRATSPWLLAGVKSTSYAVNMAAEAEAHRRGVDDAIFVDRDGHVLECPVSNIWWCYGDTLETPSLDLAILAGVTRAEVFRLAADAGLEVVEGVWGIERLRSADEVFTSSSVRELMPAISVDGKSIGNGAPGPIATRLRLALGEAALER